LYFDKRRYIVPIHGGTGSINTDSLRGMVVHMIVRPTSKDTEWDLLITDKEDDEMIEIEGHTGRLDERCGVPLGKDAQERVTIQFSNVSKNEPIKVIFKTKEVE